MSERRPDRESSRSVKLPSVAEGRRAYAYCAACPKLCRFSCPVSEAERRETTTPWGKMVVGHQLVTHSKALDASSAEAAYACSGCMRCTEHCRHHNEVAPSLVAVRAEAVRSRTAPESVNRLRARFLEGGSPFRESLAESARKAGARTEGRYFPGCTALTKEPQLVADAQTAASAVGLELRVSDASRSCCGYPLYAAGLLDEFRAQALAFARTAPDEPLVVGDPGCAYTLSVLYPQVGVDLPEVRLWVDEVARRLPLDVQGQPLEGEFGYHDPCHLGRGLGRYESPRALLQAALGGRPFSEAAERRSDAGCSGGGGVLPRTHPETAKEMARRQAGEVNEVGGDRTVVTACPAAKRMFERAGARSMMLETALARFLKGS